MILAVDFAARFSAFCLIDMEGNVHFEGDSWMCSESEYLKAMTIPFTVQPEPLVLAIEDLPHRLAFSALVKKVCRMQGRVVDKMKVYGQSEKVLFVPPSLWQRSYEGIWKQRPDIVVSVAKDLYGYEAPIPWQDMHHDERKDGKKVATDYCAAYLIARWCLDNWNKSKSFDSKSTSRYEEHLDAFYDENGKVGAGSPV